jgi:hypothetical protein
LAVSHRLGVRNELIEGLAPSLVEAHLLVFLASGLVAMDGGRDVARSAAMRLQRDDRGEERILRGAASRQQRIGPHQSLVGDDLQKAADVGKLFAFRRATPKYF